MERHVRFFVAAVQAVPNLPVEFFHPLFGKMFRFDKYLVSHDS